MLSNKNSYCDWPKAHFCLLEPLCGLEVTMRNVAVNLNSPTASCHLQMALLAPDQAVSHRSPEVKMASAKLSLHTGVILNLGPPSCVVLSAHTA